MHASRKLGLYCGAVQVDIKVYFFTTVISSIMEQSLTMSGTSIGCLSAPASHCSALSAGWVPAVGGNKSDVTTSVCIQCNTIFPSTATGINQQNPTVTLCLLFCSISALNYQISNCRNVHNNLKRNFAIVCVDIILTLLINKNEFNSSSSSFYPPIWWHWLFQVPYSCAKPYSSVIWYQMIKKKSRKKEENWADFDDILNPPLIAVWCVFVSLYLYSWM